MRAPRPTHRTRPTRLVGASLLLLALPGARVLTGVVPWHPSPEDDGPSSGPDPGTCEATRTCGAPIK